MVLEVVIRSNEKKALVVYGFGKYQQKQYLDLGRGQKIFFLEYIEVSDSEVDLWWPTGYGNQPLYTAQVILYFVFSIFT